MALKLELTGLFQSALGGTRGLDRAAFDRAVLAHAPIRDRHIATRPAWRELPYRTEYLEACMEVATEIRNDSEQFVVLGIGGSALGNAAMLGALAPIYQLEAPHDGALPCHILDNIDPDWVGELLDRLPLESTTFNVISKSGGTAETASQFLVFYNAVKKRLGANAASRFVLTTDPVEGALRRVADEHGFRTLPVPAGVGGRFSVLSPVGLLTAEVAGIDSQGLLEGAARVDRGLNELPPEEDPAFAYAVAHTMLTRAGHGVHVHFAYSYRMRLLADWYCQLWAESLGKRVDVEGNAVFAGATPVKAVGPTDQHSQVQLYTEGPHDKVFTILRLDDHAREVVIPDEFGESPAFGYLGGRTLNELFDAEREGTEVALMQAERPVCSIELCKLDAFHVGQYFQFLEVATAYAGGLFSINPYDQPGVEAGKVAAFALLGREGYHETAQAIRKQAADVSPFRLRV